MRSYALRSVAPRYPTSPLLKGNRAKALQRFAKEVVIRVQLVGKEKWDNNHGPRTEVTKKIWDYIKKNKLQDPVNRRMINADEKLKAVFGGKGKVSMFEMTKLVSNHLK